MQIQPNSAMQTLGIYLNNTPAERLNAKQETETRQTSDTVTLSDEAKTAEQRWQNIATKYDVHSISRTERGAMVNDLVQNGFIPNDVALHMVAPLSMSESGQDKADLLSTMKSSLEFEKSASLGSEQLKTKLKTIEILEKLDSLR